MLVSFKKFNLLKYCNANQMFAIPKYCLIESTKLFSQKNLAGY